MRVTIIAYSFYDLDYRVRRYGDALLEQGHQVDVIALRRKGEETIGSFNGATVYRIQERSYNEKGPLDYAVRNITFFLKGSFLLARLSLRHKYDLIHIHNVPDFLIFMGAFPKLFGTRLILDIHDILPEFYCQKFGTSMESFLARTLVLVERTSTRFANHVIAANDLWRKKMILRDGLTEKGCTTLLNYPNTCFFHGRQVTQKKAVLSLIYPGTISHHHGVDVLIRALALVKKDVPGVMLDIYTRANNVSYFTFVENLIDELDLRDNVRFNDPLPVEELARVYSGADIGIVCKREGIFASEAFSTKIFDYMAAGLPIVASRTKIDEYYFDESMIMFYKPEDHQELADSILRLHRDPEKRRSMVGRANKYLENNTWEMMKFQYLSLVDSLVRRSASS